MDQGVIDRYRSLLPVTSKTPVVSLREGSTPLIRLTNLESRTGVPAEWYAKFEGINPTGSFKDRGMTMAISKAKEEGARVVMCASTGNTSASAAAYAARAGLTCCVLIPEGKIALGKLAQAIVHGAIVLQIEGNFDEALEITCRITESDPITLVNSINPYRIEGQKTAAFEIIDSLGRAPDYHFIPVGNAGNITAYWKGYREYQEAGLSKSLPRMMGWQADGAAPIVRGAPVAEPETVATAIRIGNPASWKQAEAARDESGGMIGIVTDEEITEAQKLIASSDGLFCEPASAASIAGVIKYHAEQGLSKGDVIVSTLTGHGLKDPNRAIEIGEPPRLVPSEKDAIRSILAPCLKLGKSRNE